MTTDERDTMQAKLDRLNAKIDKMIALAGQTAYLYNEDGWLTVRITGFERTNINGALRCTWVSICDTGSLPSWSGTHPIAGIRTDSPTEYCKTCTTEHYPDHMHSQSQCRDCHEAEGEPADDPFAVYDALEDEYPRWRHS